MSAFSPNRALRDNIPYPYTAAYSVVSSKSSLKKQQFVPTARRRLDTDSSKNSSTIKSYEAV